MISCNDEDFQFYQRLRDALRVSSLTTKAIRPGIDAATLAKNWGIGLEKAVRTIQATTQ
jgi:hypothetical protein